MLDQRSSAELLSWSFYRWLRGGLLLAERSDSSSGRIEQTCFPRLPASVISSCCITRIPKVEAAQGKDLLHELIGQAALVIMPPGLPLHFLESEHDII